MPKHKFNSQDRSILQGLVGQLSDIGFEIEEVEIVEDDTLSVCEYRLEGETWPVILVTKFKVGDAILYQTTVRDRDNPPATTLEGALQASPGCRAVQVTATSVMAKV